MIVLDCESKLLAAQVPGKWNSIHLMGLACAVVYDFDTERFTCYDHTQREALCARLLAADKIVSFNGDRFDYPLVFELVMRAPPTEIVPKSVDLYRLMCVGANRNPALPQKGFGLGATAQRTIGRTKIDTGTHAPQLYAEGKWGELFTYCMDDVALTRDLYLHVRKHGYVVGPKGEQIAVRLA